jgi:hypothetical protein
MNIDLSLQKNKNKKSLNTDFNSSLEFENNSRELLTSDFSKVINQYTVFDDERNSCEKYRLTVTPNILATNVLSQPITNVYDSDNNMITGDTRFNLLQTLNSDYTYNFGYDIFDNHFLRLNTFKTGTTITDYNVFMLTDILSIKKSIKDNLIDDNGWLCFYNKTKINNNKMLSNRYPNEKIDLFPTRDYFSLKGIVKDNEITYNWDYSLTYPYKSEKEHILVKNINNINGIPIFRAETGYTLENGNYIEIQTPYKHGLTDGDVIRLKDSVFSTGKTYQIYSIGDINGLNKPSTFILDIDKYSDLKNISYINNIKNRRIVKYINGVESEYYLRIFKKLEEEPSSELYKLGFAKNIYSDDLHQIQYVDDINISGLTDNLNRPLSELYLSFFKRNIVSDPSGHNNVFNDLKSGVNEIPGVTGYTNIRIINTNNVNEANIENNITVSGTSYGNNMFVGDIVEFNKYLAKENVLDDIMYRFNLTDREKTNEFSYHEFVNEINENLLLNTNNFINLDHWFTAGETPFGVATVQTVNGIKQVELLREDGTGYVYIGQDLTLKPLTTYTISFMYRNNAVSSFYYYNAGISGVVYSEIPINNTYTEFSFSFTTDNSLLSKTIRIDCNGNGVIDSFLYVYNIKLEEGTEASVWTPAKTEPSDLLLVKNTVTVQPKNEGYFYKPHYKIPIKNYSEITQQGELIKITPCETEPFISGVTSDNSVVLLSYIGSDLTYLLLKVSDYNNFSDFDRIRISKLNSNNEITGSTTLNIRLFSGINDNIAIPYIETFFGTINNVNSNKYLFSSYYSPDIPSNSFSLNENKVVWRNILPEGIFDSESIFNNEIPFTNGNLYLNRNLNLYVRRQDPFGGYGLKDRTFPSDLFGSEKTDYLNNNIFNANNEIC